MRSLDDELLTPLELTGLLDGMWRRSPDPADWAPSRVFQRATKRKNPAYQGDDINIVSTFEALELAQKHLADVGRPGGAIVLPRRLISSPLVRQLADRIPVLEVPDGVDVLEVLAVAGRQRLKGSLILVTGTAGKTTTRRMAAAALEPFGSVCQNRQNWNFTRHIFEDLASIRRPTTNAVLELGLGEPGVSLDQASAVARPDVVVLTNVGMAHHDVVSQLELGKSDPLDRVLEAKLAAFDPLDATGLGVISSSVVLKPWALHRLGGRRWLSYGERGSDPYRLLSHVQGRELARTRYATPSGEVDLDLQVAGRHMALNGLAVLAAIDHLNLDRAAALSQLSHFSSRGHRLRITPIHASFGTFLIIDDHFNANAISLDAGLQTLRELADAWGGKAIAVLGDLVDHSVWGSPERFYSDLATRIVAHDIDVVATFGPKIETIHRALPPSVQSSHHPSRKRLRRWLLNRVGTGDVLLLKASKDMQFARLSSLLRQEAAER